MSLWLNISSQLRNNIKQPPQKNLNGEDYHAQRDAVNGSFAASQKRVAIRRENSDAAHQKRAGTK